MANLERQISNISTTGGSTKGIYLPNKLIKNILEEMLEREESGENKVSFAKVVQEVLTEHYDYKTPEVKMTKRGNDVDYN